MVDNRPGMSMMMMMMMGRTEGGAYPGSWRRYVKGYRDQHLP